jgi:hypothetical protein
MELATMDLLPAVTIKKVKINAIKIQMIYVN